MLLHKTLTLTSPKFHQYPSQIPKFHPQIPDAMVEIFSPSGRFYFSHQRRLLPWILSYPVTLLTILWVIGFGSVFIWQTSSVTGIRLFGGHASLNYRPIPRLRPVAFNLTEFGAVGDGATANTAAFEKAVEEIQKLARRGVGSLMFSLGFG